MSKTSLPPIVVPPTPTGTTASPGLVTIISDSPGLRVITKWVVLRSEGDGILVEVYRDSSSAPGACSCEVYPFRNGTLGPGKKKAGKFYPPSPPEGAKVRSLGGLSFYAMADMTAEQVEEIHHLLV